MVARSQRSQPGRVTVIAGLLTSVVLTGFCSLTSVPSARADDSSPSPTASPSPTPTPTPTASPSPTPAPTPTASPTATPTAERAVTPTLTLRVSAAGSVGGRFYEDIGSFAIDGEVVGDTEGQAVEIYSRGAGQQWSLLAEVRPAADGRYSYRKPVGAAGGFAFQATLGGPPGSGGSIASPAASVTVADATISFSPVAGSIDSLTTPLVRGQLTPARGGVQISLEAVRSGRWTAVARTTSGAAGSFAVWFRHGVGSLASYQLRFSYRATNRDRTEVSSTRRLTRIKVLAAKVTQTTAAEVAKTYRSGCPVGPSKLRTIAMNFYGYDAKMHRGVLIVRSSIVTRTIRGFDAGLRAGFPLAKVNNPNVYGGNDPKQMAANNTSGFNCRKVVGNPYRMSPHSYGIAIDVNTVQNPYRDRNGKWWPANGKSYLDRLPLRQGMLGKNTSLTKRLRKDGFFWGGFWNPGRDYQHFER